MTYTPPPEVLRGLVNAGLVIDVLDMMWETTIPTSGCGYDLVAFMQMRSMY
jgi:hypothetical protein